MPELRIAKTGWIEDLPWWRRRYYTRYTNGRETRAFTARGIRKMSLRAVRWSR